MGLDASCWDEHNTDNLLISGTVILLAGLDAFIATGVAYVRENVMDSLKRYRKKNVPTNLFILSSKSFSANSWARLYIRPKLVTIYTITFFLQFVEK